MQVPEGPFLEQLPWVKSHSIFRRGCVVPEGQLDAHPVGSAPAVSVDTVAESRML